MWKKKDVENALMLQANDMQTSYIENEGNGHFTIKPLPLQAQAAPVYGMISEDVNDDGNLDLLMTGNDYGMEPYSGRHDAFMGLCLTGDGKGNFSPLSIAESGFFVKGDGKGLANIHTAKNEDILLATQNQDSLLAFSKNISKTAAPLKWINLDPEDFCADIIYKNGGKRRMEFYYGSTYLSQSSRRIPVDKNMAKMTIFSFKGTKREVL
jgi:enediyne biosynthesis protein E4